MAWILIGVPLALLVGFLARTIEMGGTDYPNGWKAFRVGSSVVAGATIAICVMVTGAAWHTQVINLVAISKIDTVIQQREDLLDLRLPEIKTILVDEYPQYEKEVFSALRPNDIRFLAIRYPEIRTIEAFRLYIEQLNTYTLWCQEQRELKQEIVAETIARKRSPFLISWFIPTEL